MTHSPPIPAGNTSPYPLQEPPHSHAESIPMTAPDENDAGASSETKTLLGVGAAVVLGVGATVAALWFAGRKTPAVPVKRAKRQAAANAKKRAA